MGCLIVEWPFHGGIGQQDVQKSSQSVLLIWSVRSVWFVWVHEISQMDQTNQTYRSRESTIAAEAFMNDAGQVGSLGS